MSINLKSTSKLEIPLMDLVIIVGKNNAGKSRLLKRWMDTFTNGEADYISPNRFEIHEAVSADIDSQIKDQKKTRRESSNAGRKVSELPQPQTFLELIALDNTDRKRLVDWHNKYFDQLEIKLKRSTNDFSNVLITIGGKEAYLAGSGSRAVLGLLSRLFDPNISHIFIDEPEIGLEPRIQKRLFKLIKKVSRGEDDIKPKKIILSTHSNLFLDKENITNNWKIEKIDDDNSNLLQITTEEQLLNTSFDLLGANPSDLFFPSNILVVEGHSDQLFISKILELKYPKSQICVHFAEGINNINHAIPAISQMLQSLNYLSLYKEKICVLVDKTNHQELLTEWSNWLKDTNKDRVIELNKNGIEYFFPKQILSSLTGIKEDKLDTAIDLYLKNIKSSSDFKADLGSLTQITKVELADKVSGIMDETSLTKIDKKILDLIEKCFTLKFDSD